MKVKGQTWSGTRRRDVWHKRPTIVLPLGVVKVEDQLLLSSRSSSDAGRTRSSRLRGSRFDAGGRGDDTGASSGGSHGRGRRLGGGRRAGTSRSGSGSGSGSDGADAGAGTGGSGGRRDHSVVTSNGGGGGLAKVAVLRWITRIDPSYVSLQRSTHLYGHPNRIVTHANLRTLVVVRDVISTRSLPLPSHVDLFDVQPEFRCGGGRGQEGQDRKEGDERGGEEHRAECVFCLVVFVVRGGGPSRMITDA